MDTGLYGAATIVPFWNFEGSDQKLSNDGRDHPFNPHDGYWVIPGSEMDNQGRDLRFEPEERHKQGKKYWVKEGEAELIFLINFTS